MQKTRANGRNGGGTGRIGLVALLVSVLILLMAFSEGGRAEEASAKVAGSSSPLVIPIFPRQSEKDPSDDSEHKQLPAGADLRDSYVILEDGSVLSVADWVLGGLNKNDLGAGMSDYQNRLFLGQVARAMVGEDESLVNRSVVDVGPLMPYQAPPPIAEPLQFTQAILTLIMPGRDRSWSPATSGGGFDRRMATEGGAAVLFEEQFQQTLDQTAADFQKIGMMLNMLDDQ